MISKKAQAELRERLTQIAREHSQPDETGCAICREPDWMPPEEYHRHLVDLQMSAFGAAMWADVFDTRDANGDDE